MTAPYEQEVIELHQYFEDWLAGEAPIDAGTFNRLARAIAPDCVIINPDGTSTSGEALLAQMHTASGSRPNWRMWVQDIRLQFQVGDLYIVTYEEWHQRGDETTGRLCTAILQTNSDAPLGLVWRHVHETWLPTS
jgi:hypothetical protein